MAVSRNARRRVAKLRRGLAETDAHNTALVMARQDIIKGNLSKPAKRDNSRGLVFNYSPAVKPVGFTRPLRWTKGAANMGTI